MAAKLHLRERMSRLHAEDIMLLHAVHTLRRTTLPHGAANCAETTSLAGLLLLHIPLLLLPSHWPDTRGFHSTNLNGAIVENTQYLTRHVARLQHETQLLRKC